MGDPAYSKHLPPSPFLQGPRTFVSGRALTAAGAAASWPADAKSSCRVCSAWRASPSDPSATAATAACETGSRRAAVTAESSLAMLRGVRGLKVMQHAPEFSREAQISCGGDRSSAKRLLCRSTESLFDEVFVR